MHPVNCLPITIDQDWSRIQRRYHDLVGKIQQGLLPVTQIPRYKSGFTSIGAHGGITSCYNYSQDAWHTWIGESLQNLLPWSETVKSRFDTAGLKFKNFSYFEHCGPISRHIDSHPAGLDVRDQCNVNYIVDADPASRSYYIIDQDTYYYDSEVGKAFLMHTGVEHWVDNHARRAIFQMRFLENPQTILEYFQHNPLVL